MKTAVCTLVWVSALTVSAPAQIYADFQTSLGAFSCELFHTTCPRTVANFMTLADGSRAWLDEQTGLVAKEQPFYDGLTFHRVVNTAGFAIAQSGSRTADGTDGPGFTFPDEMKESVPLGYKFDQPYLLAMANSGPNTNGSQFFVTGTTIPHLEGLHTVFGRVVTGSSVVDAILAVSVNSNDKPLTAVTIQSVAIRRVGKEATKFKTKKQPLPTVSAPKFKTAALTGGGHRLLYKQAGPSMTRIWTHTPNNPGWALKFQRYVGKGEPALKAADVSLGGRTLPLPSVPSTWLRPSLTTYTADALVPEIITKWQISLSNGEGSFEFKFPLTGDQPYSFTKAGETTPQTGTIVNSYHYPDGYGTTLILELSSLPTLRFRMAFDAFNGTAHTGRQNGSFYNGSGWTPMADGTNFTMSPLP